MRPLRIIATTADAERLRGALVLAAAQAALGGDVAIFLQLDAVALLRAPVGGPRDAAHQAAGLPSLAALIDDALELDVRLIACQSGLALHGMSVADLPGPIDIGGPIGFLQQVDNDARLLMT
ncbi:MAG: DsrE family protein [Sphingomonadaceae bacterium]|nr:DsrE family protein [Sphingomonadaceae bacterium]